ncbi:hypothetical protein GGR55DRAFT_654067 [Xylaria sp. FL0064]|nr:hypothetical protein GGR55DRAFT_654067 [Xylaria sp. FL0064]
MSLIYVFFKSIPGTQSGRPTKEPRGDGLSGLLRMVDNAGSSSERWKSSVTSLTIQARTQSTSPPRRSQARQQIATPPDPDFLRRDPQQGKLWDPEGASSSSPYKTKPGSSKHLKVEASKEDSEEALRLIKQPKTRPISQEQLVAEVKGQYAGLMMVESKCIEVDKAQFEKTNTKLNNDQWQALIALHRTLLHEHHDFFLASQHPSGSQALKILASKYAMPARMWRHGIHSFLELLRHRLPGSLEHMLTFIYLAYSMMALLYETVPAFEDIIIGFDSSRREGKELGWKQDTPGWTKEGMRYADRKNGSYGISKTRAIIAECGRCGQD